MTTFPLAFAPASPLAAPNEGCRRLKDGERVGIKAKTKYPERRGSWPKDEEGKDRPWPPDTTFALVQAGLLNGKSIGFLPLKVHTPDEKEYQKNGWAHDSVKRVIDEWLLIEYACCFLPVNRTRPADHVLDTSSRLKARPYPGSLRHALVRVTTWPTTRPVYAPGLAAAP